MAAINMDAPFTLLDWITLPAGSWADWFSGTMSASAVAVAVGSYFWAMKRERKRDVEAEKSTGRQLGIKIAGVANQTHDILRHFQQFSTTSLDKRSLKPLHWKQCPPLIGIADDPTLIIDQADINLLIKAGRADFLMELRLVVARYQSAVRSLVEYKAKYESALALLPPPTSSDGARFTHEVTKEEFLMLKTYDIILDTLINGICSMIKENFENAEKLAKEYHPMMLEYFKENEWLRLRPPSERASEIPTP